MKDNIFSLEKRRKEKKYHPVLKSYTSFIAELNNDNLFQECHDLEENLHSKETSDKEEIYCLSKKVEIITQEIEKRLKFYSLFPREQNSSLQKERKEKTEESFLYLKKT